MYYKKKFIFFGIFVVLLCIIGLKSTSAAWKVDMTPPVSSFDLPGALNPNCNDVSASSANCLAGDNITIYIRCEDNHPNASGCDRIFYRVGTGGWENSTANPVGFQVSVADGNTVTISAYSRDMAGNREFPVKTFTITFEYMVSGNVFEDADGDGVIDTGETNVTDKYIRVFKQGGTQFDDCDPATEGCDGTYSLRLPAGTHIIESQVPPGHVATYPRPSIYSVTLPCSNPASDISPQAYNVFCAGGHAGPVNFGVNILIPWIQCIGGDCRVDRGFVSKLPGTGITCTTDSPSNVASYASVYSEGSGGSPKTNGTPGIIFTGNINQDFGGGTASNKGWLAGGISYPELFKPSRTGVIKTSYNYYRSVLAENNINATDISDPAYCNGGLANCILSSTLPNGVYISNGDLTLNGNGNPVSYTFPGGRNFVIFVNGDLNIRTRIIVPNDSTVTFSVKDNINVHYSVGDTDPQATCNSLQANHPGCHLEGFYSTDQSFNVEKDADDDNPDLRLNVAGSVVVNAALGGGSFINNRSLGGDDATCPVVTFTDRPDFIFNSPEFIRQAGFVWQEVAP